MHRAEEFGVKRDESGDRILLLLLEVKIAKSVTPLSDGVCMGNSLAPLPRPVPTDSTPCSRIRPISRLRPCRRARRSLASLMTPRSLDPQKPAEQPSQIKLTIDVVVVEDVEDVVVIQDIAQDSVVV